MPFTPFPAADIRLCDLTSLQVAEIIMVRTWYNLDPSLWSIIPERITFHVDGKGEFSSPFTIYSQDKQITRVLSCKFTWRPTLRCWLGEMVSDTIPKLIRSEEAWTYRTWTYRTWCGLPTHLRVDLDEKIDLKPDSFVIPDPFIPNSPDGILLPPEILEVIFLMASEEKIAAQALTTTCRRSREMVMKRRRWEAFTLLTEHFVSSGVDILVNCGHFDPVPDPKKPPTSFYGIGARLINCPPQGLISNSIRDRGWNRKKRIYYSCKLPLPEHYKKPTFWRRLIKGGKEYDEHPEVQKIWT